MAAGRIAFQKTRNEVILPYTATPVTYAIIYIAVIVVCSSLLLLLGLKLNIYFCHVCLDGAPN